MFRLFGKLSKVVILTKCDRIGHRFGFAGFLEVSDVRSLEEALGGIVINGVCLRLNADDLGWKEG